MTQVYRRFQISFQSHSEASNLIEIIKPVCPCKINPTSVPPLVPRGPPHSHRAAEKYVAISAMASSFLPDRTSLYGFRPPSLPAFAKQKPNPVQSSQPAPHEFCSKSLTMSSSPSRFQASSNPLSSDSLGNVQSLVPLDCLQNPAHHGISSFSRIPTLQTEPTPAAHTTWTTRHGAPPNIPSSSLPSLPSSDNSVHVPDRPSSMRKDTSLPHLQTQEVHGLPPSFGDASSIYNMPNPTLERIIGEIVHEDGFVQLVSPFSRD